MQLTVQKVLNSLNGITQFGQGKFPIQTSLIIAANNRALQEVATEYEKRRQELVKKYSTKDKDDNTVIPPEKVDIFQTANGKYLDEEVEVDLQTVSLKELGAKFEVEPNALVALDWMITMEGQKPTRRRRKAASA